MPQKTERTELSGEAARQGEIVLRTRRRRIVFIAGLIAFVLFAVLVRIAFVA